MESSKKKLIQEIFLCNNRFVEEKTEEFFKDHALSQNPQITLITCSDSRVQTEIFTKEAVNKIFVIRNIGNQIENNLGSVDFGVLNLKTPVLLILGHTDCGAIKTFLSGYKNEKQSIRYELDHLQIPLKNISKNDNVLKAIEENVNWQVEIAVKRYQTSIEKKELTVIGGIYDFSNKYNKGFGRIIVININGKRELGNINKIQELKGLPEEILEKITV